MLSIFRNAGQKTFDCKRGTEPIINGQKNGIQPMAPLAGCI